MKIKTTALAFALLVSLSPGLLVGTHAQDITIRDEGSIAGRAREIDCVGTALSCGVSGGKATITSDGSVGDLLDAKFVRKTADTSRVNDTLTDDPHLTVSIGANEVKECDIVVAFNASNSATPDIKSNIGVPAGATGMYYATGPATAASDINTTTVRMNAITDFATDLSHGISATTGKAWL